MRPGLRRVVAAAIGVAVFGLAWALLPGPSAAIAELGSLRGAGGAGLAWFALLYAVGTVILLPGGLVQGAAGFLYGPVWGFFAAWPLGVLSGTISFFLARTVLRDVVEARLGGRLRRLDHAISERGTLVVALVRISPLSPFNAMHYAFGLTAVTWRQFALGTLLGGTAPTVLFVYVGSTVAQLTDLLNAERSAGFGWPQLAGLVLTLVATAGITGLARNQLARLQEPVTFPLVPEDEEKAADGQR